MRSFLGLGALCATPIFIVLSPCASSLFLSACGGSQAQQPMRPPFVLGADSFDFAAPVGLVALPKSLREISGMVAIDDERVACVQDEKGNLYEARLKDGELLGKRALLPDGDYEGLARVDDAWFFARSDGALLRVREADGRAPVVDTFVLDLPQKDLEALSLDPAAEGRAARLLVAGKEPPEGSKQERDLRFVFAFDLERERLDGKPAWELSRKAIRAAVAELQEAARARNAPDDRPAPKPKLQLHVSELAVQPDTGLLWILSGPDRALLAVDRDGALRTFVVFDEASLPQPEAIAFLPCGDLVVASEGKGGPAVVARFALRR